MVYSFIKLKLANKIDDRQRIEQENQKRQKLMIILQNAKDIINQTDEYNHVHPIFLLIKGLVNDQFYNNINVAFSSRDSAHTVPHIDESDIFPRPDPEYYKLRQGISIEVSKERKEHDEKLNDYNSTPKNISIDIYLGYDPIMTYPWNTGRLIRAYKSYGSHVSNPWIADRNHHAVLIQPFGITIIRGGNHSITTGILLNEGKIHVEASYDMSGLFPSIYTDGVHYFRTIDDSMYAPVNNFSMAAIFEIGKLIDRQKHKPPYKAIEFSSLYLKDIPK